MLTRKIRQNIEILFIFARTAPIGRAIKKRGLATLRLIALLWRGLVNVCFQMSPPFAWVMWQGCNGCHRSLDGDSVLLRCGYSMGYATAHQSQSVFLRNTREAHIAEVSELCGCCHLTENLTPTKRKRFSAVWKNDIFYFPSLFFLPDSFLSGKDNIPISGFPNFFGAVP